MIEDGFMECFFLAKENKFEGFQVKCSYFFEISQGEKKRKKIQTQRKKFGKYHKKFSLILED